MHLCYQPTSDNDSLSTLSTPLLPTIPSSDHPTSQQPSSSITKPYPLAIVSFFLMIRRPPTSTLFPYTTFFLFFFNDTATTEIYTLSLHDALPISVVGERRDRLRELQRGVGVIALPDAHADGFTREQPLLGLIFLANLL